MNQTKDNVGEYRVLEEMNENNAISVLSPSADRVYQIVEYEDRGLRDELALLDSGKLIQLDLTRAGSRANVWKASWPDSTYSSPPV